MLAIVFWKLNEYAQRKKLHASYKPLVIKNQQKILLNCYRAWSEHTQQKSALRQMVTDIKEAKALQKSKEIIERLQAYCKQR